MPVAINTAIYSKSGGSVGLGFAIPGSFIRRYVAAVIAEKKFRSIGRMGVEIQQKPGTETEPKAIVVGKDPEADNGKPTIALLLGLRKDDKILKYNGYELNGNMTLLIALTRETHVYQSIELLVERNTQRFPLVYNPSLTSPPLQLQIH